MRWVLSRCDDAVVNLTAIPATQRITGLVRDNQGNPLDDIPVWATSDFGGVYNTGRTDASGHYTLYVAEATWRLWICPLPDHYLCPAEEEVVIAGNDAVVNFTAPLCFTYTSPSGTFSYTTGNGAVTILGYTGSASAVTIPGTINDLPVTGIGEGAFAQPNASAVVIPGSVANLESYAFASLFNLRSVLFQGNAPAADPTVFEGAGDLGVFAYYLPGTTGWEEFLDTTGIAGVLWDPQVQTTGGGFGVRANQFGFKIVGGDGLTLVVEATAGLTSPAWAPVFTNTLVGGSSAFRDPRWMQYPRRFYRLRPPD